MSSDADLIRAARSDPAAFRELYDRYAASVQGFHLRRTRDVHAAHDLTAETFAQAWLHRTRFRDEAAGSAGPWLYGIARNLLAQSVRRRRIELEACERLGVLERLDEALAELSDGERRALELRVVDGLSYDAVAEGLATSPGAARVRVARGLGRLREPLDGDEREAV
jgi:RNA polymerase sigma-70 factor (ECF subfamily)